MFVSPAYAQAGGAGAAGPGMIEALLPIVLIFVVFYFLLIRPQQKKMKQHKEMLTAIRRGDRVVTGGGIVGTVVKVIDDNEVQMEIAEGVRVRVQRALVSSVLSKPQPAGESKGPSGAKGAGGSGGATSNDNQGSKGSMLKKILGGKGD